MVAAADKSFFDPRIVAFFYDRATDTVHQGAFAMDGAISETAYDFTVVGAGDFEYELEDNELNILVANSDPSATLVGLGNPWTGRRVRLMAVDAWIIAHDSGSASDPAFRIYMASGADLELAAFEVVNLIYDPTGLVDRWFVDGGAGSGGGMTYTADELSLTLSGSQFAVKYAYVEAVPQTAHGFVVGNAIYRNGAGTWAKAVNSDESKVAGGLVVASADADNFIVLKGPGAVVLTTGQWDAVTGGSGGLTVNDYYWLDVTAGMLTTTRPTTGYQQPLGQASSTTVLDFFKGPVILSTPIRRRRSDDILTGEFWEDNFLGVSSTTLGAESITTLAASSGSVSQVFSFAGGIGQYALLTNAGSAAHAMLAVTPNANGNMMRYTTVGLLFWRCRWVFLMPNEVSDGTNTYTYKVGLAASLSASTTANDVFIDYTHGTNSGNWVIRETVSSVVQTPVNTSAAPKHAAGSSVIDLTMSGTTFEFWQNGVSIGTIPMNSIVSTTTMFPIFSIKKSAGTASRVSYINYFCYEGEYASIF